MIDRERDHDGGDTLHQPAPPPLQAGVVNMADACSVGIQGVESYLVTPLVQQRTVSLPPALTLTAQVVLGILLGGLGVILATPLFAAVVVLVKMLYIEDTLGDTAELPGPGK